MSDGFRNSHVLDILGKDSIIGSNFVLKQETWCYEAINNTTITVKVLRISHNLLYTVASQNNDMMDAIQAYTERVEVNGLPQIDYIIKMNKTTSEEIRN